MTSVAVSAGARFRERLDLTPPPAPECPPEPDLAASHPHAMVGESPTIRAVSDFIAKAAPTNATVLICGESGTGKELVARSIHERSPRAGGRFVAVNCAALTATLLETELFGHERGAFTGAVSLKKGKFEVADGGTIFLDEIGELAPELQPKFLRVLQEREFERVAGTQPIRLDIRVIAATNRDLSEAVKTAGFRADLFYRLNVISVTMPPLRDRRADVPLLAKHFLSKHRHKSPRHVIGISDDALAMLIHHDWPGNVRELENAIERAIVLGSGPLIRPFDLLPQNAAAAPQPATFREGVREAKKRLVLEALVQTNGNHHDAARRLGLHPNNLHRLLRNLNLRPPRE
jgi:transcriptional regulator with GAF, ATPase, and Fis domain